MGVPVGLVGVGNAGLVEVDLLSNGRLLVLKSRGRARDVRAIGDLGGSRLAHFLVDVEVGHVGDTDYWV